MIRLALLLTLLSAPAEACRQALILALDISSSVSQREYEAQRDGLAGALIDPAVADRIIGPEGARVHLFVFEWGDFNFQRVLLDWTEIDSRETLRFAAQTIRDQQRLRAGTQSTGIGGAMQFSLRQFAARSDCGALTLDVSGDGKNNSGPRPRDVRGALAAQGITINGLVIATRDVAEMSAYYHAEVIEGPQAFVEVAAGFEDYGRAIRRKLLRELTPGLAMVD